MGCLHSNPTAIGSIRCGEISNPRSKYNVPTLGIMLSTGQCFPRGRLHLYLSGRRNRWQRKRLLCPVILISLAKLIGDTADPDR